MNYLTFAKTALNLYGSLNGFCEKLDRVIKGKIKFESGSLSEVWAYPTGCLEQSFKEIAALIEQKKDLCNLKIRTENAIISLNKKHAKVLILRYHKGFLNKDIAAALNISERMVYRLLEKAIEKFARALLILGLTEPDAEQKYLSKSWFKKAYITLFEYKDARNSLKQGCQSIA